MQAGATFSSFTILWPFFFLFLIPGSFAFFLLISTLDNPFFSLSVLSQEYLDSPPLKTIGCERVTLLF